MSEAKRVKSGSTQYDALEQVTTIVADTGDFNQIKKYAPTDATTNPSLIFKASQLPEYSNLVDEAVAYGKQHGGGDQSKTLALILDKLSVAFGTENNSLLNSGTNNAFCNPTFVSPVCTTLIPLPEAFT